METTIYDYVFHYNHITQNWAAIPRDKYLEYWSNHKTPGVLRSTDIKTLILLIAKGEDFIKAIKKTKTHVNKRKPK